MEKEKLITNGLLYLILTSCFIMLWMKEKEIVAIIKEYRDGFSAKLINLFKIESVTTQKIVKKSINFLETVGSALILVLIIQKFYLGNFLVPTGSMEPTIMPNDRIFGNMFIYEFKKPERGDIIVFREPIGNKLLYTKRVMGLPGESIRIEFGHLYVNGKSLKDREYSNLGQIEYDTWIVPKKGNVVEIVPGASYMKNDVEGDNIAEIQKNLLENSGELPDVKFYVNGKETGMILDFLHDEDILGKLSKNQRVTIQLQEDYYLALGDNTNGSYDSRMWGFVAESRVKGKAFVRFWPLNKMGLLK